MDHDRYLPLIQTELKKLPVYIRDFYLHPKCLIRATN